MALKPKTLFKPTLICFFSFIFSVSASEATSLDQKSKACAPRNCGHGPDIKYPFWIDGLHESSCGLPDFKIECDRYHPVLEISDEDFIIKDIFHQNHSFLLASAAAYGDEHSCLSPLHNISFDGKPFHYTSDTEDFFFFYDCPLTHKDYIYELNCTTNKTHFSFAIFHKDLFGVDKSLLQSCRSSTRVPIRKNSSANLADWKKMSYVDILKRGFVLNWTAQGCSHCEKSGGYCGFENN